LRRAAVVANPEEGQKLAAKEAFVNTTSGSERDRWWPANNSGVGDRRPLQDRAKIEFEAKRRDINTELLANDCAALCDAEVWAGRLCECLPFFNHRPDWTCRPDVCGEWQTPGQCSRSTTRF
jgi:hypothetical protein